MDRPNIVTPDDDERDEQINSRPQRSRQPSTRLTYTQQSQQVCPNDEEWKSMEASFNILSTEIDKDNIDEYNIKSANMIARMMTEINANISRKGVQFVCQFGKIMRINPVSNILWKRD